MLKILEPFWNRASLGCRAAPLKKGSRISQIPENDIDRAERRQVHWLSSLRRYFYAFGVSIRCKGSEKMSFLIPAKKPKMFAGNRGYQGMRDVSHSNKIVIYWQSLTLSHNSYTFLTLSKSYTHFWKCEIYTQTFGKVSRKKLYTCMCVKKRP